MRKCVAFLLIALLALGVCGTAFAIETPDSLRSGSLRIAMRFGGNPVPGGALTLYRVGEISESNGDFVFALTGDFAESGYALDDVESVALAAELAGYARSKGFAGTTKTIGADGVVQFENLQSGLYLITQKTSAAGFTPTNPFLVSVPMWTDDRYVYDVDASPKVELEPAPATPTPTPDVPDEKLPQTGQTNWPVPILAVSGAVLFTLGWLLRFRQEREEYAK